MTELSNQIKQFLLNNAEAEYADFTYKLIPTINKSAIIGVRVPILKKFAAEIIKNPNVNDFLNALPHGFHEENIIHGAIINKIKDFDKALCEINNFLPFVNCWAVCDSIKPCAFKKNLEKLMPHIKKWISSEHTYTVRFGISMLMGFYLDEYFSDEHLFMVANINSTEYYVNMMRAWYFATALAKQYDSVLNLIIKSNILDPWTHNKTIQKATESFRITDSQKSELRLLKIKK